MDIIETLGVIIDYYERPDIDSELAREITLTLRDAEEMIFLEQRGKTDGEENIILSNDW